MDADYIKHEYAKGVWYERVRKCPRTAKQKRNDEMYAALLAQCRVLQRPVPQELANMYQYMPDWMRFRQ